ncbi:hypothetical protein [Halorubellus salinus]|uniref:hypothetical protein n=1 Tax=Halorubellus salinus TaxID=755309 RepID=UPI001D091816|nr:hypothetical protein [Halorubellus salinus]
MTRRLVPVLVVALVVLAGCTAPSTPASDTEATGNGTTADGIDTTTDDANATGPLERGPTPPGVSTDAKAAGVVVNASALLDAHERVLLADGFRATVDSRTAYGPGPMRNATAMVAAGPDATLVRTESVVHRGNGTVAYEIWQNESTTLVRTTTNGSSRIQTLRDDPEERELTGASTLEGVLEDLNFSVANVTTEDGRRVFTLTASHAAANTTTNGTYTARVVVDERGVVSAYHVRQNATGRDVTHEWTLESLDVTPTRPDWVANATERTRRNATVDATRTVGMEAVSGW